MENTSSTDTKVTGNESANKVAAEAGQQPAAKDAGITEPQADEPKAKAEGQPEEKKTDNENTSDGKGDDPVGRGPKPVGPEKQTWDNPEASEEVKKKIEDQKAKMEQLYENPNAQDPKLDELNQKQDIESRDEDPAHDKKSEKNTQDNFDPRQHGTDAPTH